MNHQLEEFAREIGLDDPAHRRLRLTFALVCVDRVRHLLEEPAVIECLEVLEAFLGDRVSLERMDQARLDAARLATSHRGSPSIDGCGHAAVSATFAVAKALEGRAIEAASYSAYAMVYAQGGSAAVVNRDSFEQEFSWQCAELRALAERLDVRGASLQASNGGAIA